MAAEEVEGEKRKLFSDFGLDDRLLKAVSKMGWVVPTLIQVLFSVYFYYIYYNIIIYIIK